MCIDAILNCNDLAYNFPTLPVNLIKSLLEFKSVSSNGAIEGCVATIDGFLLKIQTPAANETGNVKKYYLGHYSCYGINVQAACDYKCGFVFVCVAAPGGVNDITAFGIRQQWQISSKTCQLVNLLLAIVHVCVLNIY